MKEEKEREEKEWRTEDAVAWGRNPEIMERNGARGRGRPQKPRSGIVGRCGRLESDGLQGLDLGGWHEVSLGTDWQ